MIGHVLGDHLQVVYGLVVALAIVVLLTPAVGGMARLLGVVDKPGEGRRSNTRTVPRLGGLALFLGVFVPALAFLDLNRSMRGLLLGAAVATTVGAIDDFRGLTWWEKLGGQVVAASIPTGFGIWVHTFTFPIVGVHVLPAEVGVPLTVLGIVAVMNMVNFLDGLDGLAAGVCGISAATFTVIELDLGNANLAILSAILFGATLGFLRHNFYPARIFMGDSGALLLGFTLAGISVEGLLKTASLGVLVLPLAVLAVPIIDTSFVVAKRLKHGLPVYEGDRSHLHHRFLNIGYSQTRAVLTIYAWCGTLAATALATRFVKPHPHGDWRPWALAADAAIGLIAFGMSLYIVYLLEIVKLANPYIRRREQEAQEQKTA
jgi:UDP-GlcNAc:undecaprenyl-phosphate/decaprenyl-phosphate GlcNAc-1-phosphate transferase